jgi:pilus assembly protein CpaC
MHMNLTCLKRSACTMSALVALLACAIPVAAVPAPAPVAKKAVAEPVAKKVLLAPVAKKAVAVSEPVSKKVSPAPVAKKALPEPVRRRDLPAPVVPAMGAPSIYLVPLGESRVYRFAQPIRRIAVGDPKVADYIMLNRFEIYLLGKKLGSTNLAVWYQNGNLTSTPVQVSRGTASLQAMLKVLFPKEKDIHILALGPALVLSGSVSDALVAESVSRLVTAYLGGSVPMSNPESTLIGSDPTALKGIISENNRVSTPVSVSVNTSGTSGGPNSAAGCAGADSTHGVVNLLKIRNSQQVRLEVCIAQVSRTLLESLGVSFFKSSGDARGGTLLTGVVSSATLNNVFQLLGQNKMGQVAADRKPSLFRILAEPTIVTLSGKEGYFLVGGKVFVPVSIDNTSIYPRIEYEPQIYGVGLRFMPIVLDAGSISLKVVSEVSEPETGVVLAGTTTNWPAFKLSTASTNVQMNEGENLVIAGLKLDKLKNEIDSVPLLGEIPILGALFRDAKKNAEKTELMVIVRPTLVTSSDTSPELPTDRVVPPTRGELFLRGKLEGSRKK